MTNVAVIACVRTDGPHVSQLIESINSQSSAPDSLTVVNTSAGAAGLGDAIAASSGSVIALADEHDVWAMRKVERIRKAFELEGDIGVAFSDAHLEGDASLWDAVGFTPELRGMAMVFASGRIPSGDATIRRRGAHRLFTTIFTDNLAPGSRPAFRADLRDVVLPLPEGIAPFEWIGLLSVLVRPFRLITEPLFRCATPDVPWIGLDADRPGSVVDVQRERFKTFRRGFGRDYASAMSERRRNQIALFEAAAARLDERRDAYLRAAAMTPSTLQAAAEVDLREHAAFLRMRTSLRVRDVRRAVSSGAYQRYDGWTALLQDLTRVRGE